MFRADAGLGADAKLLSEVALFEGVADFVEHRADLGANRLDRCDDEDGDERGEQRILDRGDARFVGREVLHGFEHLFAPAPKPHPAANPLFRAADGVQIRTARFRPR